MTFKPSTQVNMLSLREIAAWQIACSPAQPNEKYIADLPAIQRGSVWKIKQVEELWDSIIQGFPIGAFLLSPIQDEKDLEVRGRQEGKYQQKGRLPATHHLLDGQQRSTAIALGFLDPWKMEEECKSVLWVDLATPPKGRDVAYVFRVLTRSHPWGYKCKDPAETLSIKQIREALEAFKKATPELKDKRPDQIPLTATWPRDAEAPIPLSILIAEFLVPGTASERKKRLLEQLKFLSFWQETGCEWHQKQREKILEALTQANSPLSRRLDQLITTIESILSRKEDYRVPVLVLPHVAHTSVREYPIEDQAEESIPDAIETLFVRINSGGTPLEGEELIYSLIKSHWVKAPVYIKNLQHQLAVPSRIALLSARLVLSRSERAQKIMPATPGVSEFRRLMKKNLNNEENQNFSFSDELESFFKSKHGIEVFKIAHYLLINGKYALPSVLATEIAQKSPDVFFLLLRWIDRMLTQGIDPMGLDEVQHRRLIGFVTALAWFSPDKGKAVAAIWSDLQEVEGRYLRSFFNRSHFTKTLVLTDRGSLRMIPLPDPDTLEKVLISRVTSGTANYSGINKFDSPIWKSWNRFAQLVESPPKDLTDWYKAKVSSQWRSEQHNFDEGLVDIYRQSWQSFLDNLWRNHSVLLFAQRDWLNRWFPDFDPSQPENLEDKNRPWDYDHIHPQKYLRNDNGNSRRSIPNIIWDWCGSIGNLRAWPLELNRADGDTSPANKLHRNKNQISTDEIRYLLIESSSHRLASFVLKNDWQYWKESTPLDGSFQANYLADSNYHSYRKALIQAITTRFIALYREWYETLYIADLML